MPASSKPPKNTSGAGFVFEEEVGAWYVLQMLAGEPPFEEALGRIGQVGFQRHVDGWFLDDVVLTLNDAHTVAISVKNNTQFGAATAPPDFVKLAWEQLLGVDHSAFSEATDYVGLVTTPLLPDLRDSLQFVQHHSASAPRMNMATRMLDPGFSSEQRRSLYQSFACPADLDTPLAGGDGSPARLLARARLEQFDFDHSSSQRRRQAISFCQTLLVAGTRTEAAQLWNAILNLVREKRPVAGTLDRSEVIRRLQHAFPLRDWPDHVHAWQQLDRLSRTALDRVPDLIGGRVALSYHRQSEALQQSTQESTLVAAVGGTGTGKTVAVKKWVEDMGSRLIWVDAGDLAGTSWSAFETALNLGYPLEELLRYASAPGMLVIDGLDRTSDAQAFANAAQLIRLVTAKSGDRGWTVILPCLDDEWSRVELRLTYVQPATWRKVEVPTYEVTDLQPVWEQFPETVTFIQDPNLGVLVRNLKIVDLVVRHSASLGRDVRRFVGESDIIDWYWQQVIEQYPAASRAELVKSLAMEQATLGTARVPRSALPHALLTVVDALVAERVCESADERLWFEHELLGDWARLRALIGMHDQQRREFIRLHLQNPIWHRAVRLYGLRLLERGETEVWRRERQALDQPEQHLGGDLMLDAVFFAAQPLLFLEQLQAELIANRGLLFRRMLDRFFVLASQPDDRVLAAVTDSAADQRAFVAASYRTAHLPQWIPIVLFAERHVQDLAAILPNELRRLAQEFMNSAPPGTPGLEQAARMAISLAEQVEVLPRLSDKERREIYATALRAVTVLPDAATTFALVASGRAENTVRSPEPEVDPESRWISPPDLPPKLRKLVLSPPTFVDMRLARSPWPDGPRRRIDEAFRAVVRSDFSMMAMSLLRPEVAREVILAALIEDGNARPAYRGGSDGEPAELVSPSYEGGPAWWARGPFYFLLQANEAEGVDCVLRLVDFATARWAEHHPDADTIELTTTKGPKTYLGDPGVYSWYRKHLSGFHAPALMLTAALSALEKHLYDAIDAGRGVTGVIDALLGSSSAAVLGLLVALTKYRPQLLGNARLLEVVAAPEVVHLDRRVAQDAFPPLGRPQNRAEWPAFAEWINLPHRSKDILLVLVEAFAQDDEIRCLLEHQRAEVIQQAGGEDALTATTRLWAACLDQANYVIEDGPTWARENTFTLPSEFLPPAEKQMGGPFELMLFAYRCRRILDGDETLLREQVGAFWDKLRSLHNTVETQSGSHLPLLAGAAVLLRTNPGWMLQDPERIRWCREMLVRAHTEATGREPFDPSDVMRMDWDSFAAVCLPALWGAMPGDQALREIVHTLVASGTRDAISSLVQGIAVRNDLSVEFGPLRHLVVRIGLDRAVEERLRHGPARPAQADEFRQRTDSVSEQFLSGALTSELPDLVLLKLETHAVLSAGGQDVTSWPVDIAAVWPAFSWWPAPGSLRPADLERCFAECHQLFDFMLPPGMRYTSLGGFERSDFSNPDAQEESVLHLAGSITAYLKVRQEPALFWQPLLHLGREGEAWLIPFLQAFTSELLSMQTISEEVVGIWDALQKTTLAFRRSDGDVVWFSSEVLTALMSIDHDTRSHWKPHHTGLVLRTIHLWEAWAGQGLRSPSGAASFAWFLRQAVAQALLSDGLVWLMQAAEGQSNYWWKQAEGNVMQLLQFLWDSREKMPLSDKPFKAFQSLLTQLVEIRQPQAIILAQAVGRLEP